MKIELIALGVNIACFVLFLVQWREPGKILYWLGAVILTIGLLHQKG